MKSNSPLRKIRPIKCETFLHLFQAVSFDTIELLFGRCEVKSFFHLHLHTNDCTVSIQGRMLTFSHP